MHEIPTPSSSGWSYGSEFRLRGWGAEGYRPRGEGHHATLFDALPFVMPEKRALASYFHSCRKKRNTMTYAAPARASEQETKELLEKAQSFYDDVGKWLARKHPDLVPKPPPQP